jgi:hypothetical protein
VAAYGGVLADALVRAGSHVAYFAPAAGLGTLLLVGALAFRVRSLGPALWIASASYVVAVVVAGHRIDPAAPLVAVLLLLCGELSGWSLDERWAIRSEAGLAWRRGAAVGILALAGLAVATLVVALSAVPASHGLAWTVAGAAAAVGAAGTGVWVARR